MRIHLARLGLLCLLCAALSSRRAIAAPVFSDPLTGSQFDTGHWMANTPNANVTLAPSSTGLVLSMAASAQDPIGVGLVSPCALVGDFDVQVDYQLGPWPDHSGARIGLIMNPGPTAGPPNCAIERDSLSATGDVALQMPGSEVYIGTVGPQSQPFPDVATTDMQGTLRLTRTGTTETAYFAAADGGWTTVFTRTNTTEAVYGGLGMWSASSYRSTPGGGSAVHFRNYTVNAGHLDCPDAGAPTTSPDAATSSGAAASPDAATSEVSKPDPGKPDAVAMGAMKPNTLGSRRGGSVDGGATTSSNSGGGGCNFGSSHTSAGAASCR